jgi:hypothetical protein
MSLDAILHVVYGRTRIYGTGIKYFILNKSNNHVSFYEMFITVPVRLAKKKFLFPSYIVLVSFRL